MVDLSNRAQVSEQSDSYRRGLVLGFTMAEIFVLVVFVLLLAMAALLSSEKHLLQESQKQVVALTKQIDILEKITGGEDIEKFVRELSIAREALRESGDLRTRLAEAKEIISYYEEVARASGIDSVPDAVAKVLSEAHELKEALRELGDKTGKDVILENRNLRVKNRRLESQIAHQQRKLISLGKGTEKPPCWAKQDGTPEYSYDIALGTNKLKVREVDQPHRYEEKGILPISNVRLNQEISYEKFLAVMLPLFQWSEKRGCRFFVRVYDQTGASEKAAHKMRLRQVSGRFYFYEMQDQIY